MRLATLLCTIALGCSASGTAEAGPGPSCSDRADRMGKEMAAHTQASVLFDDPAAPPLPVAHGQTSVPYGPVIQIDAAGKVRHDFRDLGTDRAALRKQIDADRQRARLGRHGIAITVAYLWADKSLSVATLIEVARALPTDLELRLVVAGPGTPQTPGAHLLADDGVKQLMRDVATASRGVGGRASVIAKALQTAIAPCVPMVRAFGDVAGDGVDKGAFLAREVPAALKSCKCQMVNVNVVEYGMLATFGVYDRTLGWLALPPAAELAARRAASVGELAAVLARR
jgi:hypothetical protein